MLVKCDLKIQCILLFIVMAVYCRIALAAPVFAAPLAYDVAEYPDIFVRENATIDAGATVDRVLAAGADVTVDGRVRHGMIIVDGNLAAGAAAQIRGAVVVIGGAATIAPTAQLSERLWVVPSPGYPLAPLVVGALAVLSTLGLAVLPFVAWLAARLMKRLPHYEQAAAYVRQLQQRWPWLYIAVALLFSAVMLTVFAVLVWETMFEKTMAAFDNGIFWLVRYFTSPGLDQVMIFISDLGYGWPYAAIVVGVFLLLGWRRRWRDGVALAICLGGGAVLNWLLKHLFARARPDLFHVVAAAGYSFPSGHAMISLCFYGMAAYLAVRHIRSWHGRLAVISIVSLLIAAIGVSRIYLGVHYPSDVVAGYAAGSMWLAFCISLFMWWKLA